MTHEALLRDLRAAVGEAHCLSDPAMTATYTTDWTGRFSGEAAAVVRPGDAGEVARVLSCAARHGAAVIPQGGNTGLVGGSVPRAPSLVGGRPQVLLVTTRLCDLRLDPRSRLLEAGAGVTLARAAASAGSEGLRLGIDLAARDSATLGGMTATNAGGLQAFRFGPMRARLAGIEAVLADGTLASHLGGLTKDNVGPDLASLLAGSEGTLAVVTRLLVRLEPVPIHRVTALVALADVEAAVELLTGPLAAVASLEAAELTLREGMELVVAAFGLPPPPGSGSAAFLTLEAAAERDPSEELAAALDHPSVIEVAVAEAEPARSRLWSYREHHTEAVSRLGVPHKLDVSVPPGRLGELVAALPPRVATAAPGARLVLWGHAAEGNLHVNVVGPDRDDLAVDGAVLNLALELAGSISAEHGIGIAKAAWLRRARTPGTLETMRRVRRALDPSRLLNPGVLEPAPGDTTEEGSPR